MSKSIYEHQREKKVIENIKREQIFDTLFNECKKPKTFQLEQFVLANYEDVADYNLTILRISNITKGISKLTNEKYELEKFVVEIKERLSNKYPIEFLKEMANKSRDFDYLNLSQLDKIKYLKELINK